MTADEIKKARELCEGATPGPWEVVYWDGHYHLSSDKDEDRTDGFGCVYEYKVDEHGNYAGSIKSAEVNAAFIAASITLVPRLLDALDEADKKFENELRTSAVWQNEYLEQLKKAEAALSVERTITTSACDEVKRITLDLTITRERADKAERDLAVALATLHEPCSDNGRDCIAVKAVERERDEARRMYCSAVTQDEWLDQQQSCSLGPARNRSARQVAIAEWPEQADVLFPKEEK